MGMVTDKIVGVTMEIHPIKTTRMSLRPSREGSVEERATSQCSLVEAASGGLSKTRVGETILTEQRSYSKRHKVPKWSSGVRSTVGMTTSRQRV